MPKIVRFHEVGDASVLKLEELPKPQPGEGEALLKVEAIGLNRAEVMFRSGAYLDRPSFPSLIGYEASGTIEAVGPGVTGLKPGDRVSSIPAFHMDKYGTYGEYAVLPAYALAPYPEHLSPAEGASIWMQYITAYGVVEFGGLRKGQPLLITAAASSVGLAAIQIAKFVGATSIATTRNKAKAGALSDAGADFVINTGSEREESFQVIGDVAFHLLRRHARKEGGDFYHRNIHRREHIDGHLENRYGTENGDDQTRDDDEIRSADCKSGHGDSSL